MAELEGRLSEWMLERLAQDELPPAVALAVQKRLLAEPEGAARLTALRDENAAFHANPAARSALSTIVRAATALERTESRPRLRLRRLPLALAISAAAAAVIAVRPDALFQRSPDTRVKGLAPTLSVYRRTGREVERLSEGALVRPGDEVQLGYTAAGQKYGAILSIDGRGVVTLHFPDRSDAPASELRLSQPSANAIGSVPLPQALALDDAPGFERFFFVTSRRPFELGAVLSAAAGLAHQPGAVEDPLRLPAGLEQTSILIRKTQP